MRKTYIGLILLFLPLLGFSQQFHSGLRLGINAAQINGDHMAGFNKLGALGGLYVSYPFNEKWSGQFEMLWSEKGSQRVVSPTRVDSGLWDVLRLDYIEVPVMAVYKFNKKISVMGGLGGAYLFHTHLEDAYGTVLNPDFMRKLELNATVGAAYNFSYRLSLFARYTNSLLPVNKGSNTYAYFVFDSGLINLVASFGVYYHFVKQSD